MRARRQLDGESESLVLIEMMTHQTSSLSSRIVVAVFLAWFAVGLAIPAVPESQEKSNDSLENTKSKAPVARQNPILREYFRER